jgi:hypothetical protein
MIVSEAWGSTADGEGGDRAGHQSSRTDTYSSPKAGGGWQGLLRVQVSDQCPGREMQRAWGLHGSAQFREIGDNSFVVKFSSEGEWKHAMRNGPW